MNLNSALLQNLKLQTSINIDEYNNASVDANLETSSSGIFLSPSIDVLGRPMDITGFVVTAANEYGKLEFSNLSTTLSLEDLSDVIITAPINGDRLMFDGTDWINQQMLITITSLSDVNITLPVANQILFYTGTQWENQNIPVLSLNDLSDVTINSPLLNQLLSYNGTEWINQELCLDNLNDVTISTLVTNQVLSYDGSEWVNRSTVLNDLSNVAITSPTLNQVLVNNGVNWVNQDNTLSLNLLSFVTISGPALNQVLTYDGVEWVNQLPSLDLDDVTDVVITGSPSGDLLSFNGSDWVNEEIPILSLNDLTDVTISGPVIGEWLVYNGSIWVNQDYSIDNLSDVTITTPTVNQLLVYDGISTWTNQTISFETAAGDSGDIQLSDGSGGFVTATSQHNLNYSESGSIATTLVGQEGGLFTLRGQTATTATNDGSQINITCGQGSTTSSGGDLTLQAGTSPSGTDGNIIITGGAGQSLQSGGSINIIPGQFVTTSGEAGRINLGGAIEEIPAGNPILNSSTTPASSGNFICVQDEYLYFAGETGNTIFIYDISDKTTPSLLGSLTDATNLGGVECLAVSGRYLYALARDTDRFTVVDILDPSAPAIVGSVTSSSLNGSTQFKLYGSYAIVISQNNDSICAVDISIPTSPVVASTLVDGVNLNEPLGLDISNQKAYVASGTSNSITCVDISDPLNMSVLSSLSDATFTNTPTGLAIQGNLLFTTAITGEYFVIINISNPISMSIIGTLTNANIYSLYGIVPAGKYVYVMSDNNRIHTIDISDPTSPILLYTYNTGVGNSSSMVIQGNYLYAANTVFSIYELNGGNTLNPIYSPDVFVSNQVVTNDLYTNGQSIINTSLNVGGALSLNGVAAPMLIFHGARQTTSSPTTFLSWGNGATVSTTGPFIPFNCKIIYLSINVITASTCTLSIFVDGVLTGGTVSLSAAKTGFSNVDVSVGTGQYFNLAITAGTATGGVGGTVFMIPEIDL